MTRWQVFGGRYDGLHLTTSGKHDDLELQIHVRAMSQPTLTLHDRDNPHHTITIVTPTRKDHA